MPDGFLLQGSLVLVALFIFCILFLVAIGKRKRTRNKRQLSSRGGVIVYLPFNSDLLQLYGSVPEPMQEEIINEFRTSAKWLIEFAQACGYFLGSEQRFYILALHDTAGEEGDSSERAGYFKEAICRLFNGVLPMRRPAEPWMFELEFVNREPGRTFSDTCNNYICREDLTWPVGVFFPDDVLLQTLPTETVPEET